MSRVDPVMAALIERVGPCTLATRKDYFGALCQSIINQQISTAAALTVWSRFRLLFPRRIPKPELVLKLDEPALRGVGLSRQKTVYMRSLADAFTTGLVPVKRLAKMSDEEVVQALIQVKGIGRWTAEMFLIFVLNRSDLLPVDDLGLCKNAQLVYGLKDYPKAAVMNALAEKWRPYRSFATWYLWRNGGRAPETTAAETSGKITPVPRRPRNAK